MLWKQREHNVNSVHQTRPEVYTSGSQQQLASHCFRNASKTETGLHARQHARRNILHQQQHAHAVTPVLKHG
jgi:hypothetical protein